MKLSLADNKKIHFAVEYGKHGNYGNRRATANGYPPYCCRVHCYSVTACGWEDVREYSCPNAEEGYSHTLADVTCTICKKTYQYRDALREHTKVYGKGGRK